MIQRFFKTLSKGILFILSVISKVVLIAVYFVCIAPFGLLVRLCRDFLQLKTEARWSEVPAHTDEWKFARKQ
jgi:hypothetical protein